MKNLHNYLFTFLVVFSAYLMICLPLVFASQMSSLINPSERHEKAISFSPIATTLRMSASDDFEPLKCDGGKYERFTIFVDNYAYQDSYDIGEIRGTIVIGNQQFDVSDILSCTPTKNLISNSQIRCSLDVERFINEKLLICPPPQPALAFTLSLTINSAHGDQTLSLLKESAVISTQTDASMQIQSFGIAEVNCILGSDVEKMVTVYHAETFGKDINWGFVVNDTKKYGEESIDCSIVTEGDIGTGSKDNTYSCILRIPPLAFDECYEAVNFPVTITAQNKDFKINDTFIGVTVRKELDLRLSVSSIGGVDCQIVSEEGDCVPLNPQRQMNIRLTGNGISNVETFAHKYRINDENFTAMPCKKASSSDSEQSYTCNIFLPRKIISETGLETYSDTSRINVTFETRYINTYGTVSDEITVSYSGIYRDGSTDVTNELKEKQDELKKMQKITKAISEILKWLNKGKGCCDTEDLYNAIKSGGFFKGLFNHLTDKIGETLAIGSFAEFIEKYGLWAFECIVKYMEKSYSEMIENYADFENNPDFADSYEPMNEDFSLKKLSTIGEVSLCMADKIITQSLGGCLGLLYKFAKGEVGWLDLLECGVCIAWLIWGGGASVCACAKSREIDLKKEAGIFTGELKYCSTEAFKSNGACSGPYQIGLAWLFVCGTKLLSLGLAVLNFIMYFKNMEILELNTKMMNMRMEAMKENQMAMTTYAQSQSDFFSNMATGMASSVTFDEMFPPKPEAYIAFNDSAGNLINSGDTVCGDDVITITYNFEKFSDVPGFTGNIEIYNDDRGVVRTLATDMETLSGEIKYDLKNLLMINLPTPGAIGSDNGLYQFIFSYGTSSTTYRLNYQEVC